MRSVFNDNTSVRLRIKLVLFVRLRVKLVLFLNNLGYINDILNSTRNYYLCYKLNILWYTSIYARVNLSLQMFYLIVNHNIQGVP